MSAPRHDHLAPGAALKPAAPVLPPAVAPAVPRRPASATPNPAPAIAAQALRTAGHITLKDLAA